MHMTSRNGPEIESLFSNPGDHRRLHYRGGLDKIGRWTDGLLVTEDGRVSFPVEDGIPRFHLGDGNGWDDEALREAEFRRRGVKPDRLIERNYDYMVNQWPDHEVYLPWLRSIAASRGPIVELAVGPGGGAAMVVLDLNPHAHYLMNDIGLWPLRQWQQFARTAARWPNLRFAQFDAAEMPFASRTVAAVVSMAGISNIGRQFEAIREAFRVLRPGGWFYAVEVLPDHKLTDKCPPEMVAKLKELFPAMERGFREVLAGIGFAPVRIRPMGKRPLVPGEGGLADFCKRHEVVIHLRFLRIRARKR